MRLIAATIVVLAGAVMAGCAAIADAIRYTSSPFQLFGVFVALFGGVWLVRGIIADHDAAAMKARSREAAEMKAEIAASGDAATP